MPLSPEILTAITEEEAALESVMNKLRQQLGAREERLSTEEDRARALTASLVATRRDEDKQLIASDESVSHSLRQMSQKDLKSLEKLLKNPYFARILVKEETPQGAKQFEYKIGLSSNPDCSIIDWRRGPLARLYYEYQEGDEYCEDIQGRERLGIIVKRNKVEIERGELVRLSCNLGSFIKEKGEWKELKGGFSGNSAGGTGLPNILSLITKEQFKLITEDADTAILVDGIAGSGKTTVALHRIAWLMENSSRPISPERSLILVHNKIIRAYISNTLPSLGVANPQIKTFTEWHDERLKELVFQEAPNYQIKRPALEPSYSVRRVKSSLAMLQACEDYVKHQNNRVCSFITERVPEGFLTPELKAQLAAFKTGTGSSILLIESVIAHISSLTEPSAPTAELAQPLLQTLSSTAKRLRLYHKDIIAILSDPQKLIDYDETKLLDKTIIKEALDYTVSCEAQGVVDDVDDSILLRLCQLKLGAITPRLWGGEKYHHIVIDEVQDYSALDLAVLIDSVKRTSDLTLVGDLEQQSTSSDFPGWEKLRHYWRLGSSMSRYMKLMVSHRSTLPIMRLADHINGERRTATGRKGKRPLWLKCIDENDGITQLLHWLEKNIEKYPRALIAVICNSIREAQYAQSLLEPTFGSAVRLFSNDTFSFEEGVVVTAANEVKGLEFPIVSLWNPSKKAYPENKLARNALYVATTRAQEILSIFTWDRPTRFLPNIHSKLVWGVDRSELLEENEQD